VFIGRDLHIPDSFVRTVALALLGPYDTETYGMTEPPRSTMHQAKQIIRQHIFAHLAHKPTTLEQDLALLAQATGQPQFNTTPLLFRIEVKKFLQAIANNIELSSSSSAQRSSTPERDDRDDFFALEEVSFSLHQILTNTY
jgi:hypothetical protein